MVKREKFETWKNELEQRAATVECPQPPSYLPKRREVERLEFERKELDSIASRVITPVEAQVRDWLSKSFEVPEDVQYFFQACSDRQILPRSLMHDLSMLATSQSGGGG